MYRTISQSLSRFATLTNKNCSNCVSLNSKPKLLLNFLQFDVHVSLQSFHRFTLGCVRLCTSTKHHHYVETENSEGLENLEKRKTNRRVSGGKKKRRLRGERSILTDPGVPIPHEMHQDELIRCLAKSTIVQGKQYLIKDRFTRKICAMIASTILNIQSQGNVHCYHYNVLLIL